MLARFTARLLIATAAIAGGAFLAHADPSEKAAPTKRYLGIPRYQVFTDKDMQTASRGNFIRTSPNNTLYFGNENGIFTFDGSSWKQIMETKLTSEKIRSICWADDEIFASSYGSIGRLESDEKGNVSYVPINREPLTPDASEYFLDAHIHENTVYYQGTRSSVVYDRRTGTITTKNFNTWVRTSFLLNGIFYISTDRDGLWRFVDGRFELTPEFTDFKRERAITRCTVSPGGQVAFATQNGFLYRVEAGKPVKAYQAFIRNSSRSIADIAFVDEERLAVASPGSGLSVLNKEGEVLTVLNERFDYRWVSAQMLHVDKLGTLWAMFNSTVGKVLLDSPITVIDERLRPNFDYAQGYWMEGQLFLLNRGRMLSAVHGEEGQLVGFEAVPELESINIYSALVIDGGMYLQADEATYYYKDGVLSQVGDLGGLDRVTIPQDNHDYIIGTSSSDIRLFKREGARLELVSEIPHDVGMIYGITSETENVFWLEVGLGRLGRLTIENDQIHYKIFTAKNGLPSDWVTVWKHEGRMIFTERSGIYEFDPASESFKLSDIFEDYLPRDEGAVHRAATDKNGNIWVSHGIYNYILWKQNDGSYIKDQYALGQLGEIYLNQFLFLDNDDAILISAKELFHFDHSRIRFQDATHYSCTFVSEISNPEGTSIHYLDSGWISKPPRLKLDHANDSVIVRISNTFSTTLKQPTFQYYLDGLSKDWSKWTSNNELLFTNLDHGDYTLKIRTKVGSVEAFPPATMGFTLEPSIYETNLAKTAYILGAIVLLAGAFKYSAHNLKSANQKLEQTVAERTKEIESKNVELEKQAHTLEGKNDKLALQSEQLQKNARELTTTLHELRSAQDQLMTTSRKAGMAEVATNVLHNVGNVLNSINIAVISLSEKLDQQRSSKLAKLSDLIQKHDDNLASFFSEDPRGRAVPEYLHRLAEALTEDFMIYHREVESIHSNIDHVKKIISTQQAHAKTIDVFQTIDLPELIESALTMILGDAEHCQYEVDCEFDPDLVIESDKHRILQMVANFIKNAKEAVKEGDPPLGMIDIQGRFDESKENIELTIADNGIGIDPENLQRIFTHGFTTKEEGHGFGMHSCANSARILGGKLEIDSDGISKGATVKLTLPVAPPSLRKLAKVKKGIDYPIETDLI